MRQEVNKMKKIGFAVLCFAVMLLMLHTGLATTALGAPKKKAVPAKEIKEAKDEQDILAKIGNKIITKSEFESRLAELPPEYQERFKDEGQKREFLDLYIQAQLLAMEAKAEKIDKERPIATRIEDMTNSILAQEYVNRRLAKAGSAPEAELQKYYSEHKAEFLAPATVKAQHILVKVDQNAGPEAVAAALAKAQGIRKELDQGADFAKLAEKYSDDPGSKSRGGDLGYFPRERMVPEFANEAFRLQPGETSQPIRSAFGFHIIRTNDKKPEIQREFNDAKAQIQTKLDFQKRKEALERDVARLKKKYKVIMISN
jgi:peptidyl-prolyl cis-trans isomerase C